MAFGFESGITSFFERRQNYFERNCLEGSFQERMKELRDKINTESKDKPTVVISGAGPAGLLRAIQSISNGNPTILIEKRAEDASRRINTVALSKSTIFMLQYCGIYQYLTENKLIYPTDGSDYIMVRLADLELAMNEVLKEISPHFAVEYHSQITKVDSQSEKIKLTVENLETKETRTIEKVDILVNTEGKNSSTNALLGIERTEVLPSIPVIAAVYKDKRPRIQGISSFFEYVGRSLLYLAQTVYYHVLFIFRFAFSQHFRQQITGSLILKTPNQNYVGCGFSDEINAELESFQKAIKEKKSLLDQAGTDQEKKQYTQELDALQENYEAFAGKWIHYSICHANMIAIIQRFYEPSSLYTAGHLSLGKFEVIKIGADHANQFCKNINQTSVLLGGDTCATVDPTTGLGCNTAIQSSVDFLDFIWDYDAKSDQQTLLKEYSNKTQERVDYIHRASKFTRSLYRPDALHSMAMMTKSMQSSMNAT